MKQKKTSAVTSLSRFFGFMLFAVIAGIGVLLFFAYRDLPPYAKTVNQKLIAANLSTPAEGSTTLDTTALTKASLYFAPLATAQAQAEKDIRTYAQLTGVTITSITTDQAQSTQSMQALSVKVSNTPSYNNLLQFMTSIEKNLPRMSVQSISLTNTSNSPTGNSIAVKTLVIGVAVR